MTAFLGIGLIDALCWLFVLPPVCVLAYRGFARSASRGILVIKWIVSVLLIFFLNGIVHRNTPYLPFLNDLPLPFVIVAVLLPAGILGVMWAPQIGAIMAQPFTSLFEGGREEADAKPFYFIAEAKRRKGLYQEAVAEIRRQLEKFPGDVEGMMRLAALQAEDMRDLPAAETTIAQLLQQPNLPPNAAVAALQTLADWQLEIGRDTGAARASLERIVNTFPDSSFSHAAIQRLAHVDGADQARQFHEETVFKVPAGERNIGLRQGPKPEEESPEAQAIVQAAEHVRQLQRHPNDTETREKLALLYAEKLQRVDLAAGQLEQLTTFPNESPAHIARWLDLLATVYVRYGRNVEAAEDALRRIIGRFPNTALANQANTRLATLQTELRAGETAVFKQMGVYEKGLGLKAKAKG